MANNHNKQNESNKMDKRTLYTRILCFVLAGLMIASGIFVILEAFM